jgi:hypothetical protein
MSHILYFSQVAVSNFSSVPHSVCYVIRFQEGRDREGVYDVCAGLQDADKMGFLRLFGAVCSSC